MRPALIGPSISLSEWHFVLYLTSVLTVAALFYLGYAMIRPEHF